VRFACVHDLQLVGSSDGAGVAAPAGGLLVCAEDRGARPGAQGSLRQRRRRQTLAGAGCPGDLGPSLGPRPPAAGAAARGGVLRAGVGPHGVRPRPRRAGRPGLPEAADAGWPADTAHGPGPGRAVLVGVVAPDERVRVPVTLSLGGELLW